MTLLRVVVGGVVAASVVLTGCTPSEPTQTRYYTYIDRDGGAVYVPSLDDVPHDLRDGVGMVDMAGVFADYTLADRVTHRFQSEISQVRGSASCAAANFEQGLSRWRQIWYRFGSLIMVGMGALLLLLLTPRMSTILPSGMWMRTLFFVLPALIAVTILAFTMQRASESISAVRELNAMCETGASGRSATSEAKDVVRLQSLVEKLYGKRTVLLDRALDEAGIHFDGS